MDGNSSYLDDLLQAGKLDLYLGVNIPASPNRQRIELAREVMYCCFSQKLLARYYPDSWQTLLADFRREGAEFDRITDLPFGTVRQGNKLRDELEAFFAHYRKPKLVFESDQQGLIYQFARNGEGAGLLPPVIFYQYRKEIKELGGEFFIFPLRSNMQESIFSLVYRKDYPLPRYAMDFVQIACMVELARVFWTLPFGKSKMPSLLFTLIIFQNSLYIRIIMTYNNTKTGCAPACQDGNKYAIEPKNRCSTMVTAMYLFWHHSPI